MKTPQHIGRGMSLIEVAIAIGIMAFCLVAIFGLLPVMLNSVRESREKAVISRIYQTMALDLQENPPSESAQTNRTLLFNYEGFAADSGTIIFTASASTSFQASLPGQSTNTSLIRSEILISNKERQTTVLRRPVWIVSNKRP